MSGKNSAGYNSIQVLELRRGLMIRAYGQSVEREVCRSRKSARDDGGPWLSDYLRSVRHQRKTRKLATCLLHFSPKPWKRDDGDKRHRSSPLLADNWAELACTAASPFVPEKCITRWRKRGMVTMIIHQLHVQVWKLTSSLQAANYIWQCTALFSITDWSLLQLESEVV